MSKKSMWRTALLFSLLAVLVVGFCWFEYNRRTSRVGLNPSVNSSATEFKVFKTIKLGTGIKDADGFRKAIKDNNMRISDYAKDILGKPQFTVTTEETEIDLVIVSVEKLGFKDGAKLKDIYARAKEKGLQLCSNEVGPQLRLQYEDQPRYEWLVIGMEPISVSDGDLSLFYVGHDSDDLWLFTCYVSPGRVWREDDRFVFVLPRK